MKYFYISKWKKIEQFFCNTVFNCNFYKSNLSKLSNIYRMQQTRTLYMLIDSWYNSFNGFKQWWILLITGIRYDHAALISYEKLFATIFSQNGWLCPTNHHLFLVRLPLLRPSRNDLWLPATEKTNSDGNSCTNEKKAAILLAIFFKKSWFLMLSRNNNPKFILRMAS